MSKTASKVQIWNRALDRIGETDAIEYEEEDRLAADICRRHYDDCLLQVLESSPWPFATKQSSLSRPNATDSYTGDGSTTEYALTSGFRADSEVTVTVAGAAVTAFTMANAGTLSGTITFDTAPADAAAIVITYPLQVVGWEYAYSLPTDCAVPMALLDEDQRIGLLNGDDRIPFEIYEDEAGTWRLLCCDMAADEFKVLEYTSTPSSTSGGVISQGGIAGWPRSFVDAVAWRLAAELALGLKKDQGMHGWCMQMFGFSISEARATQYNARHPDVEPDPPSVAARS